MVMVAPLPLAFAILKAPVKPFKLVTPLPASAQVGQVILPAESRVIGPLALTATVPLAFGTVIVLLLPLGVAKVKVLVMPPLVLLKLVLAPCKLRFWLVAPMVSAPVGVIVFTAKTPPILTVVPLSVIILSPMVWAPVNLGMVFVVPPLVVTPPPTPAQLPAVVQMS